MGMTGGIIEAWGGGAKGGMGMMDPWSTGRMGGKGGAYVAAAGPSHEVEAFIMRNGLDEKAANCLRELGPDHQGAVLARGDLTNAQNPSSALMVRIKDAQAGGAMGGMGMTGGIIEAWGGGAKGGMGMMNPWSMGRMGGKGGAYAAAAGPSHEVEAFIMRNWLAEKALKFPRLLAPDL